MANEIRTTVVGNLTDDPELRFVTSGAAVVAFTVANNPQRYDKEAGKWTDADPSFVRCQAWRQLAENIAESLHKGDRVIVTGTFREERWEDPKTSEKRAAWRFTAESVGPDLTFATATVKRSARRQDAAPDDPWSTASKTRPEPVPAGAPMGDEPPF